MHDPTQYGSGLQSMRYESYQNEFDSNLADLIDINVAILPGAKK